jgi:hypothetical protein
MPNGPGGSRLRLAVGDAIISTGSKLAGVLMCDPHEFISWVKKLERLTAQHLALALPFVDYVPVQSAHSKANGRGLSK